MTSAASPQSSSRSPSPVPSAPATDVESMYRAELKPVWRFVCRLGIPAPEVEDLVHEVFLTAFKKWPDYDRTRPARPWLFGIAYRIVADYRRLKRHGAEISGDDLPEQSVQPPPVLERRDANRVLDYALSRMSEAARTVFVMHELEERPVPEIAELMETPVPTAYTRLRAARQIFAETVAKLNEASP